MANDLFWYGLGVLVGAALAGIIGSWLERRQIRLANGGRFVLRFRIGGTHGSD